MTSWVSGCLLWLQIPEGSKQPERRPGGLIRAANRHRSAQTRTHTRAADLPATPARYRRRYDVLTDEADVFSDLENSGFSRVKATPRPPACQGWSFVTRQTKDKASIYLLSV